MSSYLDQERDFILRTLKILEQYEEVKIQPHYETTLLLNCFVGLLMLPQQEWYDNISTDLITQKEWGLSPTYISFLKIGETKNVRTVATHLRNSVSHYNFKAFSNKKEEISSIYFFDQDRQENKTFEATIPIRNLKIFIKLFSTRILKIMDQSK